MSLAVTEAYQTKGMTISGTAIVITNAGWDWDETDLALAQRAYITARGGGLMMTTSGVTPTATLGHFIPENGTIEVVGTANINKIRLIREATDDVDASISLEK